MLAACLRGMVMVFCLLAFLGGTTVQAMPLELSLAPHTAVTMPDDCPMAQSAGVAAKDRPCHGLNATCLKQMGCLGVSMLPDRFGQPAGPAVFGVVLFWPLAAVRAGLSIAPEPFPPISA
ncbi:hypothetical protein [Nitrospirillum iridis]|uniref:Uncharacterized protein n=1 Tax=Nitrospirillum iridis TaxID=765888 RepID=A0A7X0EDY3_9PROT|nr:hypothetical protein [Nitrospirillum iridis]MBB6253273.1 hypothetical protein [Nitrospirillum iridis]